MPGLTETARPTSPAPLIVDIPPRMDESARAALRAIAKELATQPMRAPLLNMSALAAMDGAGLAALLALLAVPVRRKQPIVADRMGEAWQSVFELVHLNDVVRVFSHQADALAAAAVRDAPPAAAPAGDSPVPAAGQWAQPVSRLAAPPVPAHAVNLNVEGRRPLSPLEGFGRMLHKTYSVRLHGSQASPEDVIAHWRARFASFWPAGNHYVGADREIRAGDVGVLNLTLMGPIKLYTGVLVIYAGNTSFCFMTPQGHMFGGLINFSAHSEGGVTVASVQPTIRASDPLFELTLRAGIGAAMEDRFWVRTLANLAQHFGSLDTPQMTTEVIDGAVQWSKLGNLRHNAAVSSMLHTLAAPLRWLRR